jgi:activating signal cointegrator 1
MKAISLWEPWASLIRTGAKKWETRSWTTNYRGKLLICASKAGLTFYEFNHLLCCNQFQQGLAPLIGQELNFNRFPCPSVKMMHLNFGKAVCIVNLTDCKRTDDLTQGEIEAERLFGDFSLGRFAWRLDDVQIIEPFPVKGRQGFFNVEVPF